MRKNNLEIVRDLIDKMFEIAGHQVVFEDIKDRKDDWYAQWTMTREQNDEWVKWGTDYIKKSMRLNKEMARREMVMIDLSYGLKVADPEKENI